MATLDRSVASLRVMGDDLQPMEVSALLGASPTLSYEKGEVLSSNHGAPRIARFGFWSLEADETSPADLDSQVMGLLARLSGDDAVSQRLREDYDLDLFCGWFMDVPNEGTSLEAETLVALGTGGIALSIDLYATPDDRGLDAVWSAGSPRGLSAGYDDLLAMAEADSALAALLMPGGGLMAEHVPWFSRAGVRQFHLGAQARPGASSKAYVDSGHIRSWCLLLDDAA